MTQSSMSATPFTHSSISTYLSSSAGLAIQRFSFPGRKDGLCDHVFLPVDRWRNGWIDRWKDVYIQGVNQADHLDPFLSVSIHLSIYRSIYPIYASKCTYHCHAFSSSLFSCNGFTRTQTYMYIQKAYDG